MFEEGLKCSQVVRILQNIGIWSRHTVSVVEIKKTRPMMPSRWVNFVDHLISILNISNILIILSAASSSHFQWRDPCGTRQRDRWASWVWRKRSVSPLPATPHAPKDLSCHGQITPSIGYGRPTTIGCLYPVPLKINRKPGINHPPTWGLHGCSTFFSANSDDTRLPGSIWLSDAPVPGVSLPNEDLHGALASSEAT